MPEAMTLSRQPPPEEKNSDLDSLDEFFARLLSFQDNSVIDGNHPTGPHSSPPKTISTHSRKPSLLFPDDELDDGAGVETAATVTSAKQPQQRPYTTILTTRNHRRSLSSSQPSGVPSGKTFASTSSYYDEFGFPLFPSVVHSYSVAEQSQKHQQPYKSSLSTVASQQQPASRSQPVSRHSSYQSSSNKSHQSPFGVDEVVKVLAVEHKYDNHNHNNNTDTITDEGIEIDASHDLLQQHLLPDQEINCALSAASVSTMTKENNNHNNTGNHPASSVASLAPTKNGRKRPSTGHGNGGGGIQKALSKLALCGQSAREETLDLEYLVMTLKQALTAQEATTALRHVVKVLKDARNGSNCTPGGKSHTVMSTTELQESLVAAGADHCVISTLWNFPSHIPVQYYGIVALGELVAHSHLPNQKSIVLKGGIEVVLTAMKSHAEQENIQEEACRTLKNLCKYFDNAKQQVARHKGISRILQAMMTHPEYATVQRQACYALTSLSCLKTISDELVTKQGHAVLLKIMQNHNDDPYVLAEAWRTLTNVVIHAMNTILDEEIAAQGMPLIFEALQKFADCTVVPIQARGIALLTHLCYRSPANLELVTQSDHMEILHRVLQLWHGDEKVQAAGSKLFELISQLYPGAAMVMSHNHDSDAPVAATSSTNSIMRSNSILGTSSNASRGSKSVHSTTSSSASWKSRNGNGPPRNAVIGSVRTERGLDCIVDATMY